MTEIPAGSGQLDPETAAKVLLHVEQARAVFAWGCMQQGERLKDYALGEISHSLDAINHVLGRNAV